MAARTGVSRLLRLSQSFNVPPVLPAAVMKLHHHPPGFNRLWCGAKTAEGSTRLGSVFHFDLPRAPRVPLLRAPASRSSSTSNNMASSVKPSVSGDHTCITAPGMAPVIAPYSHATKVPASKNLVFVSGQLAFNEVNPSNPPVKIPLFPLSNT